MNSSQFKSAVENFERHNEFSKNQGARLKVKKPGHIEYTLKISKEHQSTPGTAHGGVLSGLMDSVLGVAALTHSFTKDCFCATVEFKINYLRPVHLNDKIVGVGKVVYFGKRIVVSRGELFRVKGTKRELVAIGNGTFNLYPIKKKGFLVLK